MLVNAGIGVGLAVLVAASSPLWGGQVFSSERGLSVVLLAVGVASFAVYAHLCGALSGMLSWSSFALLLSVDALIRLAAAVVAVAAGWGTTAFLVITVIGSVSWCVLLLVSPAARAALGVGGDVPAGRLTANTLTAMAAAAAGAVLVMGFPVLINLTANLRGAPDADEARVIGALILAVTLTRAPLLVPLNSFQGVLISRFVDRRHRPFAALAAPLGVVGIIGGLGMVAAWMVGPWLLRTVFGADFDLDGLVVALLTGGATGLALLTVTGAAAIAAGAHRWYAAGWWVATIVAVAMLLLPAGVEVRTCVALILGPVAGLGVHLLGVLRRGPVHARHPWTTRPPGHPCAPGPANRGQRRRARAPIDAPTRACRWFSLDVACRRAARAARGQPRSANRLASSAKKRFSSSKRRPSTACTELTDAECLR